MTFEELAERFGKHGLKGKTMHSVLAKLKRGTFPATFLIAS